ncbi:MAG: hypothetical protein IPM83_16950 [Ignavibacteria bacterium]|nr:hypothetical protein [Ignavibacteria bacterium]
MAAALRVHEGRSLRTGVTPLPSVRGLRRTGSDVLAFASSMRIGVVGAYGIGHWRVGDPDRTGVDTRSVRDAPVGCTTGALNATHIDREHRDEWCDLLFDKISASFTHYAG